MMIIRQSNGFYYVSYFDGKRTRKMSLRTKDSTEAHTKAALAVATVNDRKTQLSVLTVAQVLDHYWQGRGCNAIRFKLIKTSIAFLNETMGDLPITDVTDRVIALHRRRRKVVDGTMRRELGVLVTALNWCRRRRLVPEFAIPVIELPPASPPRERWLTVDELDRLTDAAASLRQGDRLTRAERFIAVAVETGARRQAIIDLQWNAIDFDRGLIDFGHGVRVQTTKRRPIVPISDRLLPILERAHRERTGRYVLDHTSGIRLAFLKVCQRAGPAFDDVTPHTLRHSWASNAAMAGVPFVEIARVLGNSTAMVERVYSKFAPGYLRQAMNWRKAG